MVEFLLAELGVSKEPCFSSLILTMLDSVPNEILESSHFLQAYFDEPKNRPLRERLALCRANLGKCFAAQKVFRDAAAFHALLAELRTACG
jgi:hypothetical protein